MKKKRIKKKKINCSLSRGCYSLYTVQHMTRVTFERTKIHRNIRAR